MTALPRWDNSAWLNQSNPLWGKRVSQHRQKKWRHTWCHSTNTCRSFDRYFMSTYYVSGSILGTGHLAVGKKSKSLGKQSMHVVWEEGDADVNREGEKRRGERQVAGETWSFEGTSRCAWKVNPLGTLSNGFGLGKEYAISCPLFHLNCFCPCSNWRVCSSNASADELSAVVTNCCLVRQGNVFDAKGTILKYGGIHGFFFWLVVCIQRGNGAYLLSQRNSPRGNTVFLVGEQRENDSEKSKFYRPTLHEPCIIQLGELMYDVCDHHQTCVANNSCLQLLKDVSWTLSPAQLDQVNSWSLMEMILQCSRGPKCLSV